MQKDKSFMGFLYEQRIFDRLKTVENAKIVHTLKLYSPKLKRDTDIDICLVSEKGLFVLEVKRYTTMIEGNKDDVLWTLSSGGSIRKKFNFSSQNEHHARVLHFYIERLYGKGVPIYDYIICPDKTNVISDCENIVTLMEFISLYRDLPVCKDIRLDELKEVIDLLKRGGSSRG